MSSFEESAVFEPIVSASFMSKGRGKGAKAKEWSEQALAHQLHGDALALQALTNAANVLDDDHEHFQYGQGDDDDLDEGESSDLNEADVEFLGSAALRIGTSHDADEHQQSTTTGVQRSGKMIFRRSVTMLTKKLVRELSEAYRRCFPKPEGLDEATYESRLQVNLLKKVIPAKLDDLSKAINDPEQEKILKRANNAQRQRAFRERRRAEKEKEKMVEQKGKVKELITVVEKKENQIEKGKAFCDRIQFRKRKRMSSPVEEENGGEQVESVPAVPSFTSTSALIHSVPFIATAMGIQIAIEESDDGDDFSISSIDDPSYTTHSFRPQSPATPAAIPIQLVTQPRRSSGDVNVNAFDPVHCAKVYVQTKYGGDGGGLAFIRESKMEFFQTAIEGIYAGVGKLAIQRKELKLKIEAARNNGALIQNNPQLLEDFAYFETLKDRIWMQRRVKEDLLDLTTILLLAYSADGPITPGNIIGPTVFPRHQHPRSV